MNNPLGIVVHELPGTLPAGAIVPAAELARRKDFAAVRDTLLAAAHADADALRQAGETALEQAHEAAEQVRAAARDEADALGRQAQAQAVDEAVQWLCAEHVLAQRLAAELAQRWRSLTAQVLDEVLGQRDLNERVLHHVEQRVAELLPQGRLTLAVAPEALAHATQVWAATPALSVVADVALAAGQARLENARLRLHLDAPAHQAALLTQFAQFAEGAAHDTAAPGVDADTDAEAEADTQADMQAEAEPAVDGDVDVDLDLDPDFEPLDPDPDLDPDLDLDAVLAARAGAASALTPRFTQTATPNAPADPWLFETAPSRPATWLTDFADEPWEVSRG